MIQKNYAEACVDDCGYCHPVRERTVEVSELLLSGADMSLHPAALRRRAHDLESRPAFLWRGYACKCLSSLRQSTPLALPGHFCFLGEPQDSTDLKGQAQPF